MKLKSEEARLLEFFSSSRQWFSKKRFLFFQESRLKMLQWCFYSNDSILAGFSSLVDPQLDHLWMYFVQKVILWHPHPAPVSSVHCCSKLINFSFCLLLSLSHRNDISIHVSKLFPCQKEDLPNSLMMKWPFQEFIPREITQINCEMSSFGHVQVVTFS